MCLGSFIFCKPANVLLKKSHTFVKSCIKKVGNRNAILRAVCLHIRYAKCVTKLLYVNLVS